MIMKADTDKPHRCPECWCIPDIIWEEHGHARLWFTYTCPNGHRFARWCGAGHWLIVWPVHKRWLRLRRRIM